MSYENEEMTKEEELSSYTINSTGGGEPDEKHKNIIHLYATNQIDYETAVFALKRLFRMKDPYLYEGTDVLINIKDIRDTKKLDSYENDMASLAIVKLLNENYEVNCLNDI